MRTKIKRRRLGDRGKPTVGNSRQPLDAVYGDHVDEDFDDIEGFEEGLREQFAGYRETDET